MTTKCHHKIYNTATAQRAVQRKPGTVAYTCKDCEQLHMAPFEEAAGLIVVFSNTETRGFMVHFGSTIENVK